MRNTVFSDNTELGYRIAFGSDDKQFTVVVAGIRKEDYNLPAREGYYIQIDNPTEINGVVTVNYAAIDYPTIAAANVEANLVTMLNPGSSLTS